MTEQMNKQMTKLFRTKVLYLFIYLTFIHHSIREEESGLSLKHLTSSERQFLSKCVPFSRMMPKIQINARNKCS